MDQTVTRNVERQGNEADALIAQLAADKQNTSQEAPQQPQQQEASPQEATPPQQIEQPVEQPVPQQEQQQAPVDWQARYNSLQGKYNAEVPRLHGEVQKLKNQLEQLQNNPSYTTEQPKAANVQEAMSNLQKEWGEEFVNQISAMVQAEVGKVESRVNSFETSVQAMSKNQKMQRLTEILMPDGINFDQVDNDPEFHTWLNTTDHMSGLLRHNLLMTAFNSGELERAAIFYREFAKGSQPQQRPPEVPQNPLNEFVQPQVTNRPPETAPQQTNVWTEQEIAAFYRDYNAGKIEPAKAEQLEREIFAASQSGTIVNSQFN